MCFSIDSTRSEQPIFGGIHQVILDTYYFDALLCAIIKCFSFHFTIIISRMIVKRHLLIRELVVVIRLVGGAPQT